MSLKDVKKDVVIFATLGVSPMVITEFLQKYSRQNEVSELVIIYTSDQQVRTCYRALLGILAKEMPKIKVRGIELPYSDTTSVEEILDFICRVSKEIRKYEEWRKVCCIAGGRKTMSVLLAMLAQYHMIGEVYHVISPSIRSLNIEYEELKREIEEIGSSENPEEEYSKKVKEKPAIRNVFFPPLDSYELIRIPVLPHPPSYTWKILNSLMRNDFSKLSKGELDALVGSGLVDEVDGGYAVSKLGGKFVRAVLGKCEELRERE